MMIMITIMMMMLITVFPLYYTQFLDLILINYTLLLGSPFVDTLYLVPGLRLRVNGNTVRSQHQVASQTESRLRLHGTGSVYVCDSKYGFASKKGKQNANLRQTLIIIKIVRIYGNNIKARPRVAQNAICRVHKTRPVSYTHLDVYKRQPHGQAL